MTNRDGQRMARGARRRHAIGADPRRESRQFEAEERLAARSVRSRDDQLALLDARPGDAERERARLLEGAS